jgi:CheY-like chemotaxis protein
LIGARLTARKLEEPRQEDAPNSTRWNAVENQRVGGMSGWHGGLATTSRRQPPLLASCLRGLGRVTRPDGNVAPTRRAEMMKILVIDDDEQVRRTISRILGLGGHEALTAEDGSRGMALFLSERPEIVITDVFMPEQEGIDTIVKMRRENPRVKIIAISGGGQIGGIDVFEIAHSLSVDEVIAKPFWARELLGLIGELKPTGETEDPVVF